jgi:hypothetical protein
MGLTALAAAVFCVGATAQVYHDGYGRPSDGYSRGGPDYRGRGDRSDPVTRALSDLRGTRSYSGRWDNNARKNIEKAEGDLIRFQDKWYRGHWDNGRLDSAIEHIQHVVNDGRISPRDRDILSRDMWALRDFRAGGRRY